MRNIHKCTTSVSLLIVGETDGVIISSDTFWHKTISGKRMLSTIFILPWHVKLFSFYRYARKVERITDLVRCSIILKDPEQVNDSLFVHAVSCTNRQGCLNSWCLQLLSVVESLLIRFYVGDFQSISCQKNCNLKSRGCFCQHKMMRLVSVKNRWLSWRFL